MRSYFWLRLIEQANLCRNHLLVGSWSAHMRVCSLPTLPPPAFVECVLGRIIFGDNSVTDHTLKLRSSGASGKGTRFFA